MKMSEAYFARPARRSHFIHVRIDDGEVGTNSNASKNASDDEVGIVSGKSGIERTQSCNDDSDDQHISSAISICQRTEHERAQNVSRKIKQNGCSQISARSNRCTPAHNLDTGLNKGDINVEDVVKGEEIANTDNANKESW